MLNDQPHMPLTPDPQDKHWALSPRAWVLCGVIVFLIGFSLWVVWLVGTDMWSQAWKLFAKGNFGFSHISTVDGIYLKSYRSTLEMFGILIAGTFLAYWIEAHWKKPANPDRLLKLDRLRPLQGIVLLSFAVFFLPFSFLGFFTSIILFHNGLLLNEASFTSEAYFPLLFGEVFFLTFSGAFYGLRRNSDNDELIQHYRSKAIQTGYWAMIVGGLLVYVAAAISPIWERVALPLVLYIGVAAPMIRFALLQLKSTSDA